MLLAINPEWQEWIAQELDTILNEKPLEDQKPVYADVFPKLVRCLALMVSFWSRDAVSIWTNTNSRTSTKFSASTAPCPLSPDGQGLRG